jgi:uncharacterized protein
MSSPSPAQTPPTPTPCVRPPRPISKTLLHWTRALHTYATMFALILLIFFSFTGFILNNGGLYENSGKLFDLARPSHTSDRTAQIPRKLFEGNNYLYAVEHYLREHQGARGKLPEKLDDESQVIHFPFQSPGRTMDYAVIRDTGEVEIHTESNILSMMTDLHTGEHTGRIWPWLIDATAAFLLFASLSGVILWISLPKRRRLGLIAFALSLILCLAVYLYLVP